MNHCSFLRWRFLCLWNRTYFLLGFAMDAMSCYGLRSGLCLVCDLIRSGLSVRIADAIECQWCYELPSGLCLEGLHLWTDTVGVFQFKWQTQCHDTDFGTGNISTRIVGAPG
ncbi:hypothetical protein EDD16DRAFT_162911 [Pisolithus croceorrhizus]|nr:hypothetical protein EDD16DRAFT_162911 [Pisolithus croceorrhizus]KAI6124614.1 hypothetical protein EV401DRAFT_1171769 [Pisolithus croceorrhizus]